MTHKHFKHLLLLFCLSIILSISRSETRKDSFPYLPMKIDQGSWTLDASLYEQFSDTKYVISELLSMSNDVTGKISISSDAGSTNVFYSGGSLTNDERLVIHDNRCDLFKYKNAKWDSMLPGVKSSFINQILLLGPSIIYRLKDLSLNWKRESDAQIRGITMYSVSGYLEEQKLHVTYFYKKETSWGSYPDITQAERVAFQDQSLSNVPTYIMDIYQNVRLDGDVSSLVFTTPEIGCPSYFMQGGSIPRASSGQLHYILLETVTGPRPSSKREEIYAHGPVGLVYRKVTIQGKTTEFIYDYSLGISYELYSDGECSVAPVEPSDPSVVKRNDRYYFYLNALLDEDTSKTYKFLGYQAVEKEKGNKKYLVFEAVEYNKITESGTYDKVVTTQYFVYHAFKGPGTAYILHSSIVNAYNKASSGSFNLIEKIQRNYFNFGSIISDKEYKEKFRFSQCYKADKKKVLAFKFHCEGSCDYFAFNRPYQSNEEIRSELIRSGKISSSRIANIEILHEQNTTTAYVTFTDVPPLRSAFRSAHIRVDKQALGKFSKVSVDTVEDCLRYYGSSPTIALTTPFEAVAYCDNKACARIPKFNDIVESQRSGPFCTIFHIPFKNLNRYTHELSLESIQDFLNNLDIKFTLKHYKGGEAKFKCTGITEVSQKIDNEQNLFFKIAMKRKLASGNKSVKLIEVAKNFGECYRTCDDENCSLFAVCTYSDRFECLSTNVNQTTLGIFEADESCSIYQKSYLFSYDTLKTRKYKNALSIPVRTSLSDCASLCYQSNDCYSFQYCRGQCSFAGLYTDSAAEYDSRCNIYVPKVADKFIFAGQKIASETFHTELNLTMDQCAALCDGWNGGEESCSSFQYCPKGKTDSSCSLSKFSSKNLSSQFVVSDSCSSYEYKEDNTRKRLSNTQSARIENGGLSFGIIVLFIVIGLVTGSVIPFACKKIKSLANKSHSNSLSFSKHTDEAVS